MKVHLSTDIKNTSLLKPKKEMRIIMSKLYLISYFTHTGHTRVIAELIHERVGGTLFEIQPKIPYPESYNEVVEISKKEIQDGYRPELKCKIEDIESYDTIFIGSPNWCSTIAPPVAAFLSENNLCGKTIIPFCTHGGSGLQRIEKDISNLCPQSIVVGGMEIYGSDRDDVKGKVNSWLKREGIHA